MQQAHRAGTLKQSNKTHKTRHRSKRGIAAAVKGKVNVKEFVRRNRHILKKDERRHQALQIRKNKREEVIAKKRALGGSRNPPFLICVVPLNSQLDVQSAVAILTTCSEGAVVTRSENGTIHVALPNFKQRFSLICPDVENEFGFLDALKVADTVMFISSALAEPVDESGEKVLALAMAQGMPTPVVVAMDIEGVHPKKRTTEKQNVQKLISKWLPDEKVMQLDKTSDGLNIFRRIGNQKRNVLHHREKRPYMLAENVVFVPNDNDEMGTLKVSGFLRGMPLNVNGLVHIPGLGDFQMSQIDGHDDPHPLNSEKDGGDPTVTRVAVLQRADPARQESLVAENVPDAMDAEQTWPTEEEIAVANQETRQRKVKKVPKGWSDYQAAWIAESDAEDDDEGGSEEEEEDEKFMSCEEDESEADGEGEGEGEGEAANDFESVADSEIGVSDERYDAAIDASEEVAALRTLAAAREQLQFPDEVDTPRELPAAERFAKYRGLESFRTSQWDPKENLPEDYARIFQFENYERTRRRVYREAEDSLLNTYGLYATVHIPNVRKDLWSSHQRGSPGAPLVLVGLLPHEQRMSVMNVVLRRTGGDEPVRSKSRLILQVGYRRMIVNPVFSQHTNGSKHKYERFFQPASTVVATFFAPIQFSPSSVLCFKEKRNTSLQLVASGVLQTCNPDRLIIKRIVLSGHPYKVNKRSAVIRFMFFNRDDVTYFKPCKLRTKYGRSGHIKEPLGTHGHMKVVFDGQLKSQDTVLLNLYKRVFPKWSYEPCVVSAPADDAME